MRAIAGLGCLNHGRLDLFFFTVVTVSAGLLVWQQVIPDFVGM